VVKGRDLWILAEAFLYPEETWKEIFSHLFSLAQVLGLPLPEDLQVKNLRELQAEYTRLFINSPYSTPVPPYASVYLSLDRRLQGEGYEQARAFYRQAGLEPVEEGELADHLAYELSFMALLLEEGRFPLLGRFLSEHFLRWYPRFLVALEQADPLPLYRLLGRIVLAITHKLQEVVHEKAGLS